MSLNTELGQDAHISSPKLPFLLNEAPHSWYLWEPLASHQRLGPVPALVRGLEVGASTAAAGNRE